MPHGDGAVEGLLFSDLEGSTARLRALGDRYGAALARHHAILRRALTAEGGREIGSEGAGERLVANHPAAYWAVTGFGWLVSLFALAIVVIVALLR